MARGLANRKQETLLSLSCLPSPSLTSSSFSPSLDSSSLLSSFLLSF